MVTRVRSEAFVRASQTYFASALKRANQNGNAYLTVAEAEQLPKDLRDNFASFRAAGHARVSVRDFEAHFTRHVEAAVKAAAGTDGFLSRSEARKLPVDLRDNFLAYVQALEHPAPAGTVTEQGRKALGDYVKNVLFNTGNPEGAAFQRDIIQGRTGPALDALRAQWDAAAAQWAPDLQGWEAQPGPTGGTVYSGGLCGLYAELRFEPGKAPTVMVEID